VNEGVFGDIRRLH